MWSSVVVTVVVVVVARMSAADESPARPPAASSLDGDHGGTRLPRARSGGTPVAGGTQSAVVGWALPSTRRAVRPVFERLNDLAEIVGVDGVLCERAPVIHPHL